MNRPLKYAKSEKQKAKEKEISAARIADAGSGKPKESVINPNRPRQYVKLEKQMAKEKVSRTKAEARVRTWDD